MMAALNTQPGSSRPKQRQLLHELKRKLGWSDDQLHEAIGVESTTLLSASQASACIKRLGGGQLANPPGKKPGAYAGRKTTGAVRMISDDQIEQIARLGWSYFRSSRAFAFWMCKDFKVPYSRPQSMGEAKELVRHLATAKRAGEVIAVLKRMHARKRNKEMPADG